MQSIYVSYVTPKDLSRIGEDESKTFIIKLPDGHTCWMTEDSAFELSDKLYELCNRVKKDRGWSVW